MRLQLQKIPEFKYRKGTDFSKGRNGINDIAFHIFPRFPFCRLMVYGLSVIRTESPSSKVKNSELGGIKRPFFFLFILNSEKEFDRKNIVFLTFE